MKFGGHRQSPPQSTAGPFPDSTKFRYFSIVFGLVLFVRQIRMLSCRICRPKCVKPSFFCGYYFKMMPLMIHKPFFVLVQYSLIKQSACFNFVRSRFFVQSRHLLQAVALHYAPSDLDSKIREWQLLRPSKIYHPTPLINILTGDRFQTPLVSHINLDDNDKSPSLTSYHHWMQPNEMILTYRQTKAPV